MTRRKESPSQCAFPGCAEPRYWDKRRNAARGRYCGFHRRASNRVMSADPLRYTPAEVLAAWDSKPFGGDFFYDGRRVFGMQMLSPDVYRVQLAGLDEGVRITAADKLERVP